MKIIECEIHGPVEALETDPVLLRYVCADCQQLREWYKIVLDRDLDEEDKNE